MSIPRATTYAFGTLLEGIAAAMLYAYIFPGALEQLPIWVPLLVFGLGAWLALTSYHALKHHYRIERIDPK